MTDSKEVVVLIILIFFVLVTTARAESETLAQLVKIEQSVSDYQPSGIIPESSPPPVADVGIDVDAPIELGVVSTSSMSNVEDDYGLVVTLSTSF